MAWRPASCLRKCHTVYSIPVLSALILSRQTFLIVLTLAPLLFEKNVDGVNYFFTKKFGIYFVATTKTNVAPSTILDIIYRMMKIFRDYCGVLNEESIRKNFVLIYEIIDEVIDYGHAQLVTTENIRQFIVNEPVLLQPKA